MPTDGRRQGPLKDTDAERSVLGAMMNSPKALSEAGKSLNSGDFYRPNHASIFEAIIDLKRRREPIDLVTVKGELDRRECLEDTGGVSYLDALLENAPADAEVVSCVAKVSDASQRRRASGSSAPVPASPTSKPFDADIIDLYDVPPPGEPPLLFGPYMLKGSQHWLTGQTGLGKSTFGYNLACTLAEGAVLWGIECEPQKVLYIDPESGDYGRSKKVERLYQGADRVRGSLLFKKEAPRLPAELDSLLAFAQEHGIGLVIFDTARRCFPVRNEDDNAEFYERIAPILDALKLIGVATLTFGHPPKNGGSGSRGAGAQMDAGDVNLTLTMLNSGEVSDPNGVVVLRVTKNRLMGLGVPPLYLKRVGNDRFERVMSEEVNRAEGEHAERPGRQEQCKADMIEFMETRPQRHATYKEIIGAMKAKGHSESTAKRVRTEMEDAEDLIRAEGGGYVLPDPFAE